jgi:hypothetical protein
MAGLPRLGIYENVLKCSTAKTDKNANAKPVSTDLGMFLST